MRQWNYQMQPIKENYSCSYLLCTFLISPFQSVKCVSSLCYQDKVFQHISYKVYNFMDEEIGKFQYKLKIIKLLFNRNSLVYSKKTKMYPHSAVPFQQVFYRKNSINFDLTFTNRHGTHTVDRFIYCFRTRENPKFCAKKVSLY